MAAVTKQETRLKLQFVANTDHSIHSGLVAVEELQLILRLLFRHFGARLAMPTNGLRPRAATLWRVTVESWLRCQGLISIRQNQEPKVSTNCLADWSHN